MYLEPVVWVWACVGVRSLEGGGEGLGCLVPARFGVVKTYAVFVLHKNKR